eukprot:Tbor_TRINITY_DN5622_c0_g1::TRINITY_DN5622_c0_g1_i1::g.8479::m.8479
MKKSSQSPKEVPWVDVVSQKGIPPYDAATDIHCLRTRAHPYRTGKPTKFHQMTFADIQNVQKSKDIKSNKGRKMTGKVVKVKQWSVGEEESPPRNHIYEKENDVEIMLREANIEEPDSNDHIRKIIRNWNAVFGDVVESWAFYGVNQQILPKVKSELNAVRREQELLREAEENERYTRHKANLRAARQIELSSRSRAKHELVTLMKPRPPSNGRNNIRRRIKISVEPEVPKHQELVKPSSDIPQTTVVMPNLSTTTPVISYSKAQKVSVEEIHNDETGKEFRHISQKNTSLLDTSSKSDLMDSTGSMDNQYVVSVPTGHISCISEHMESV